jgi:hypothetical protein
VNGYQLVIGVSFLDQGQFRRGQPSLSKEGVLEGLFPGPQQWLIPAPQFGDRVVIGGQTGGGQIGKNWEMEEFVHRSFSRIDKLLSLPATILIRRLFRERAKKARLIRCFRELMIQPRRG